MSPSRLRRNSMRVCRHKYKLTMEEAAARLSNPNYAGVKNLHCYVCPACTYLHFGHIPNVTKTNRISGQL